MIVLFDGQNLTVLSTSCDLVPKASDGCQCICEGQFKVTLGNPTLACSSCNRNYHNRCVTKGNRPDESKWICPICCVSKGLPYNEMFMRVRWAGKFASIVGCTKTESCFDRIDGKGSLCGLHDLDQLAQDCNAYQGHP